MAVKTFTAGAVLTSADTNTYLANSGLVYVTSTTVGTAVASKVVTSCFNSTFDNYLITYEGGVASVGGAQLRLALNVDTANNYYSNLISQTAGVATVNGQAFGPLTGFTVIGYVDTGTFANFLTITNPNKALNTTFHGSWNILGGSSAVGTIGGWSIATGANTGFTYYPSSGTLTGGTITVYGYRKA
jgi:hypothetical protein